MGIKRKQTPLFREMLLEDIDEFVDSLSSLKERIEASEDTSDNIYWIETRLPLFLDELKKNNKERRRCVTVEWAGPFSIDEVLEMTGDNDYGVYQIYGYHITYGTDSLLYIGETTDQSFGKRIANHKQGWVQKTEGILIRVGRIVSDYDAYERKQLIKDTEALAIKLHLPSHNSNNIGRYNGRLLKVVNTGEYGSLQREYESS